MEVPPVIGSEGSAGTDPPVIARVRSKMGAKAKANATKPSSRFRYFSPADFQKFRNLFFAAKITVEGAYAGMHRSPFKGASPEFVDYREYYPGDDIKTIDWK